MYAVLAASMVMAAPTFVTFSPSGHGSHLNWEPGCGGHHGCTTTATFSYAAGVSNQPLYDGPLQATLTYEWAPVGSATSTPVPGVGTQYSEDVSGYFTFSFTPHGQAQVNLLTVDFTAAYGVLAYNPATKDLSLTVSPATNGAGDPPIMTSDVVNFGSGPITDWTFVIDFGHQNPGISKATGDIKNFVGSFPGFAGADPLPVGQTRLGAVSETPEPASMLLGGVGLLALGGLLRLKNRRRA